MTLGLIVAHGGLLLFDSYLRPGLAGVTLPFAMGYRPVFTGIGIIAGWLAAILGLSFYVRKWIGVKVWRRMHRFMIVVSLLALGHVVGAGTNARSPWMLAMLTALTAPIVFAFTYRMLPTRPPGQSAASRTGGASSGRHRVTSAPARDWRLPLPETTRRPDLGGPGPVVGACPGRSPPGCHQTRASGVARLPAGVTDF